MIQYTYLPPSTASVLSGGADSGESWLAFASPLRGLVACMKVPRLFSMASRSSLMVVGLEVGVSQGATLEATEIIPAPPRIGNIHVVYQIVSRRMKAARSPST